MGTLEDGTVFDDTRARHEPYTFRVGLGFVIGGWDKGIPTMMKGLGLGHRWFGLETLRIEVDASVFMTHPVVHHCSSSVYLAMSD